MEPQNQPLLVTPTGSAPAHTRRRGTAWGWVILIVLVGFLGVMVVITRAAVSAITPSRRAYVASGYGPGVALIRLEGRISDDSQGDGLFGGPAGSRQVIDALHDAAQDDAVKAIVLRVNSPGGSAAASQEMYEAVIAAKARKMVIVSMGDAAASGGYYVSSAANYIFANPATVTGSIGVISEFPQLYRLADKVGIGMDAITSGPAKDTGNPFRPMRPDERALMAGIVKDVYGQFVHDVAAGRGMDEALVRKLADGRVYTGSQAKKVDLVDALGGLNDALDYAGAQSGVGEHPPVREYGRHRGVFGLFSGDAASEATQALLLARLASSSRIRDLLVSNKPMPRTELDW